MLTEARRRIAIVGALAALATQVGLPALHTIVHRLEVAVARAQAARWRTEARGPEGRTAVDHGHRHETSAPAGQPGEHPDHHHPGDAPGEHGAGAPEHLDAALIATRAPLVPWCFEVVLATRAPAAGASVGAPRPPATDRNRGPPGTA